MIKFTMIGTGSAFAKEYFNTSALVEFTDGYRLLIDCGATTPTGMYRLDRTWDDVDGVLITHIHADHIGGLEEVAFMTRYVTKRKLDLFVPDTIGAEYLWDSSLKGGLRETEEGICNLHDYFNVREINSFHPTAIGNNKIQTFPTDHVKGKQSCGVVIDDRILYSGDTRYDETIFDYAVDKDIRYIFHDCQFNNSSAIHASIDDLLYLPRELQKRVFLMHYGDDAEEFKDHIGKMRFALEGNTYLF